MTFYSGLPSRYWQKVSPSVSTGCWLWTGATDGKGYGQLIWRLDCAVWKPRKAHKLAYESLVGPVPAGLELDHLCRVRNCVNPLHLEPVLHSENVRRGDADPALGAQRASVLEKRARTHCKRGHLLSGDNLAKNAYNRRQCLACRRLLHQERKHGR